MLKNGWFWFTILLAVVVIFLWKQGYLSTTEKVVTYRLPTTTYPPDFGPFYWKAIHSLVGEVPCPSCREEGKSLFIFAHDVINFKLGKPIFSPENFKYWQNRIATIDITKPKTESEIKTEELSENSHA